MVKILVTGSDSRFGKIFKKLKLNTNLFLEIKRIKYSLSTSIKKT